MLGNPRQSWILDSALWIPDSKHLSRFCILSQWNLDSGFQSLVSFLVPGAVFHLIRIPEPTIPNCTSKTFHYMEQ